MSAEFAGKAPASSAARTSRIECALDNDPRLMASIGAVISHAAKRAGLPDQTQEDVAAAAVEASREMVIAGRGNGSGASTTKLVLDEFPDRLELTIESSARRETRGNSQATGRQVRGSRPMRRARRPRARYAGQTLRRGQVRFGDLTLHVVLSAYSLQESNEIPTSATQTRVS